MKEEGRKKVGMGFLLFRKIESKWTIFIIKELKDKPQYFKKAGMRSFPLETQKEGETDEETIRRLVKEETPFSWEQVDFQWIAKEKFNLIPGRKDIFIGYGFGFFKEGIETIKETPVDPEIEVVGWKGLGILLKKEKDFLRIEVWPVWMDFLKNYASIVFKN